MTDTPEQLPGNLEDEAPTLLPAPSPRAGVTGSGWPYALPTDKRINWPATSQALAEKLDADLMKMDRGLASVIAGRATISFRQGLFTGIPPVVSLTVGGPANRFVSAANVTTAGCEIFCTESDGVTPTAAGDVLWVAVGD